MNKSLKLRVFFAGMLVSSAIRSLHEDALGKENFLKMAEAGWLDWTITVPLAGLLLCIAYLLYTAKDS